MRLFLSLLSRTRFLRYLRRRKRELWSAYVRRNQGVHEKKKGNGFSSGILLDMGVIPRGRKTLTFTRDNNSISRQLLFSKVVPRVTRLAPGEKSDIAFLVDIARIQREFQKGSAL